MTTAPPRLRVALTGVRTFLGDHLIRALEDDPTCEHILALDIRPPVSGRTKTRFSRVDLTDPASDEQMAKLLKDDGIDTLVHMAFLAYPSHSRSWAHELEAIGSLYVMNAAADSNVRKVVLPSTTAVYGASPSNPAFLSEDAPLRGARGSRWVTDRVAVEKELARLKKDCPKILTTSLRFGMTVGPTIRNFYTKLLTPQVVPAVMGYDPLMQYLHEDDAVAALLKAVREDHPGAYNIVGDGTLYFSDVIRLGGKLSLPVPHFLGYPAANALFNVQLSVVPGAFLDYFRYAWVADARKMRDAFGFAPQYTSRGALLAFFDSQANPSREASHSEAPSLESPMSEPATERGHGSEHEPAKPAEPTVQDVARADADIGDIPDIGKSRRHEHRDRQMDVLFDRNPISDGVFESKTDILSLEEVLEALDKVKGLPPLKAAAELFSRLGIERLQSAFQRMLASRKDRVIDEFGLDEAFLTPLEPIGKWFHDNYFRVESEGLENVPDTGRCLLVANHSGTLPYDATMVVTAVRYQHPSQRRVRPLVEDFIYHLPFLGMFMSRVGAVRACQENAQRLLENDHATLVFPEGVKGIGKLYSKRYRLQRFGRGGAVRLAAVTGSPMIPVSIVGAEESMPLLSKVSWLARPLGLPYIPITPTLPWFGPLGLIPLPTKWYIDFGEPIPVPDDPEALIHDRVAMNRLNEDLRHAVQRLIDKRLASRPSVFGGLGAAFSRTFGGRSGDGA